MKKCFLFFILLLSGIILLCSINAYAAFLIEFKDGRIVSAENYRMERDSIVLYLGNGSVRMPKNGVQSIREKKEEIGATDDRVTAIEKTDVPQNPGPKISSKDPSKDKNNIDSYIERKAEIQRRLEEAKQAYFNATEKSDKKSARETMVSVSKELISLQEEVMKNNNGILPGWWVGN